MCYCIGKDARRAWTVLALSVSGLVTLLVVHVQFGRILEMQASVREFVEAHPYVSLSQRLNMLEGLPSRERQIEQDRKKEKKERKKERKTQFEKVDSGNGETRSRLSASELDQFFSSSCFRNISAKQPHDVMNVLDGKVSRHHPVMLQMLQLPVEAYQITRGYITELNGLKVPAEFDCDNLNIGWKSWGAFPYFYAVASRWHTCWLHYGAVLHRERMLTPALDYVDDEYMEQVAVYHSVFRAKRRSTFAMAELGARWGTWGSRAIALWKRLKPGSPYQLHFVEADKTHCSGIQRVMQENNISSSLSCDFASEADIRSWASNVELVDLIDLDIQTAEKDIVPQIIDMLNKKVLRVICGTHTPAIHDSLLSLFRKEGWREIWSVGVQNKKCMRQVTWCLRRAFQPSRISSCKFPTLLESKCWHQTPYGPVAHFDGELIFDNPRLARDGEHEQLSFRRFPD